MKPETKFTHKGRPKPSLSTPVNPSLTRASTLLFDKAEDLYRNDITTYGRHGTEVHLALCELFNELESGVGTVLFPSGLASCTYPILAHVKSGDHILLTDSCYGPIRSFCENQLQKFGVETEIYDPRIGSEIETLIRPNTSVIILESPGSLTLEIQDVPAIVAIAKAHKITTIIDNTWSAGLVYKPLEMGVDISCHAATKYFGGHSDLLFGAAICRTKNHYERVKRTAKLIGNSASADDAYQVLRGFRTVTARFDKQAATALELAVWLQDHPRIKTVLHPALSSHPDHGLWKRDFSGAAPLFSFVVNNMSPKDVLAFVNAHELFGIGYSYGGYESLIIHCDPQLKRQFDPEFGGPLIRYACGLEDVADLKSDITQAFNAIS